MQDAEARVRKALKVLMEDGSIDGAHHKMWVIDQAVRALTGCPEEIVKVMTSAGTERTYEELGESEEYRLLIADFCNGEEGPETYTWDTGIEP